MDIQQLTREEIIQKIDELLTKEQLTYSLTNKQLFKSLTKFMKYVAEFEQEGELSKRSYNNMQRALIEVADAWDSPLMKYLALVNLVDYANTEEQLEEETLLRNAITDVAIHLAKRKLVKLPEEYAAMYKVHEISVEDEYKFALEDLEELEKLPLPNKKQYKEKQLALAKVAAYHGDKFEEEEAIYRAHHSSHEEDVAKQLARTKYVASANSIDISNIKVEYTAMKYIKNTEQHQEKQPQKLNYGEDLIEGDFPLNEFGYNEVVVTSILQEFIVDNHIPSGAKQILTSLRTNSRKLRKRPPVAFFAAKLNHKKFTEKSVAPFAMEQLVKANEHLEQIIAEKSQ